jgi:hypothetical protein
MRPLLAIQEIAPRLAERLIDATGAPRFFRAIAELSRSADPPRPEIDNQPANVDVISPAGALADSPEQARKLA